MLPVVGSIVRLKIFFEAREQVGEELGFDAQFLTLGWVHPGRRVERHGDVVIAVHVEHDMAKQLEILADLLVAVDVIETRQDFNTGPRSAAFILGTRPSRRFAGRCAIDTRNKQRSTNTATASGT